MTVSSASTAPQPRRSAAMPRALTEVLALLLALTALSVLYCLALRHQLHDSFSAHFPLSPRIIRFSDFTIYLSKLPGFHTPAFFTTGFPFTYPAPVALVYEFFFRFAQPHPTITFLLCSLLAFAIPALWFGVALQRQLGPARAILLTGVLVLSSWPAILVLDRGNMEVVVWVTLAIATWAFCTDRWTLAAVAFGAAAALKLFPCIFLALFLSTRDWRRLLIGISSFALISLAALAILGPTVPFAASGIAAGLLFFRQNYMAQWHPMENGVDHSVFALVKYLLLLGDPHRTDFASPLSLYLWITALAGTALYFLRIQFLPLLNQLLLLSISSVWLTAFSGDGTLLHLYYPFAALLLLSIQAALQQQRVPRLTPLLLLLAAVLAPASFLVLNGQRVEGEGRCLLLGIVFVLALCFPFGPPLERKSRFPLAALPSSAQPLAASPAANRSRNA